MNSQAQTELLWSPKSTLPDRQMTPVRLQCFLNDCGVSLAILLELFGPECSPGPGDLEQTAIMPVPEAAMYMYCNTVLWQHKIRVTCHPGGMKPKPIADSVQFASD